MEHLVAAATLAARLPEAVAFAVQALLPWLHAAAVRLTGGVTLAVPELFLAVAMAAGTAHLLVRLRARRRQEALVQLHGVIDPLIEPGRVSLGVPGSVRESDLRAAAAMLGAPLLGVLVTDPAPRERVPHGDLYLLRDGRYRTFRVPLTVGAPETAGSAGTSGTLGFVPPPGLRLPAGLYTKALTGRSGEVGRLIVGRPGLIERALDVPGRSDTLLPLVAAAWTLRLENHLLSADAEARLLDFVESLIASVEAKDVYTSGHSKRVCRYSVLVAQQLGIGGRALDDIAIGAALHDVGKLGIPERVLTKPAKLDDAEWALMRSHPKVGAHIIDSFNRSPAVVQAIFHHHERFDGRGYPAGLKGDAIPLPARIVGVADALDAMTSGRSYQRTRSVREALEEIRSCAGTQFDPQVAQALLRVPLNELEAIAPARQDLPSPPPAGPVSQLLRAQIRLEALPLPA